MRKWLFRLISLLTLLGVLPIAQAPRVYAQDSCTSVLPYLVEATTEQVCREINENWICYGNKLVAAAPGDLRFLEPADRQPIASFAELLPEKPMGLALMRVRSTTDPGPVNVIIFGELGVKTLAAATFEIAAKSSAPLCSDTPSGLVVQTEEGKTGAVKINGVEIILGSTAFVTINTAGELTITNIEGNVRVTLPGGVTQVIPVNQQLRILAGAPTAPLGPEPSPYVGSPVLQFLAKDPKGLRRIGDPNTRAPSIEAQVPPCGGKLAFGQTVEGATFTLGQECLYTFTADLNSVATINMRAIANGGGQGKLDPWLDLRGPDLHLLSRNNDIGETNLNSQLCNIQLPVRQGVYTIVARAAGNDTKGAFRLQLEGQTSCLPPEPRCEVTAEALNLRTGPDIAYAPVKALPQGARLQWLGRNPQNSWLYVKELNDGVVGWVSAAAHLTACENNIPPIVQTPLPLTGTPTVQPSVTSSVTPQVTPPPTNLTATPQVTPTPTNLTETPQVTPTPTNLTETPQVTPSPTNLTETPQVTPPPTNLTETPTISVSPICVASALQQKYALPAGDVAVDCIEGTPSTGGPAPVSTPAPAHGTKEPNVPGP